VNVLREEHTQQAGALDLNEGHRRWTRSFLLLHSRFPREFAMRIRRRSPWKTSGRFLDTHRPISSIQVLVLSPLNRSSTTAHMESGFAFGVSSDSRVSIPDRRVYLRSIVGRAPAGRPSVCFCAVITA
jgi:hypothetical protein